MTPSTAAYWDRRAREYDRDPERCVGYAGVNYQQHARYVKRLLTGLVLPGHKVLDVGCGYGRFARTVLARGGQWFGVDFSEVMQERWRRCVGVGTFIIGDALKTPCVKVCAPFDLILCVGSNGSMGLEVDGFVNLYAPLLRLPGQIVVVGGRSTTVRSFFQPKHTEGARLCQEQT